MDYDGDLISFDEFKDKLNSIPRKATYLDIANEINKVNNEYQATAINKPIINSYVREDLTFKYHVVESIRDSYLSEYIDNEFVTDIANKLESSLQRVGIDVNSVNNDDNIAGMLYLLVERVTNINYTLFNQGVYYVDKIAEEFKLVDFVKKRELAVSFDCYKQPRENIEKLKSIIMDKPTEL